MTDESGIGSCGRRGEETSGGVTTTDQSTCQRQRHEARLGGAVHAANRVLADAGLSIRPDALPAHLDDKAEQLLATAEEKFGSYEQAVARVGSLRIGM